MTPIAVQFHPTLALTPQEKTAITSAAREWLGKNPHLGTAVDVAIKTKGGIHARATLMNGVLDITGIEREAGTQAPSTAPAETKPAAGQNTEKASSATAASGKDTGKGGPGKGKGKNGK